MTQFRDWQESLLLQKWTDHLVGNIHWHQTLQVYRMTVDQNMVCAQGKGHSYSQMPHMLGNLSYSCSQKNQKERLGLPQLHWAPCTTESHHLHMGYQGWKFQLVEGDIAFLLLWIHSYALNPHLFSSQHPPPCPCLRMLKMRLGTVPGCHDPYHTQTWEHKGHADHADQCHFHVKIQLLDHAMESQGEEHMIQDVTKGDGSDLISLTNLLQDSTMACLQTRNLPLWNLTISNSESDMQTPWLPKSPVHLSHLQYSLLRRFKGTIWQWPLKMLTR